MKWNKGSILKATVDYIRSLQNEQSHFRQIEQRNKEMETLSKNLLLRVQVSVKKIVKVYIYGVVKFVFKTFLLML